MASFDVFIHNSLFGTSTEFIVCGTQMAHKLKNQFTLTIAKLSNAFDKPLKYILFSRTN